MDVVIRCISAAQQRYPTAGDWYYQDPGTLRINVSDTGDCRYNMLIAVHELVEAILCREQDVSQEAVDAFDIAYEENRQPWDHGEPGDNKRAPYHRAHREAEVIEFILLEQLGLNWEDYSAAVESTPNK